MKQVKISPVPLTLTGTGVKPTIAKRKSAVYGDADFDPKKNLMVGQMAFNVDDKVWYYRSKTGIEELVPKSSSGEKVFFITEEMMSTGHQSEDFDFVIDYMSGSCDVLTVKTPGIYVITSTAYVYKQFFLAISNQCLNKVVSLQSGSNITYTGGMYCIAASDIPAIGSLRIRTLGLNYLSNNPSSDVCMVSIIDHPMLNGGFVMPISFATVNQSGFEEAIP